MKGYQQGDCILVSVSSIPTDSKKINPSARGFILAEGEHTGHAHVIEATPDVEMYEKDGTLYLKVVTKSTVTHEEHGPQVVAPGTYEIRRVVEYDPFEDEIRKVAD